MLLKKCVLFLGMKCPGNYSNYQSKLKRFYLLILVQKYLVFPLFPDIVLHPFPRDSQVLLAPGLQRPGEMEGHPLGPLSMRRPPPPHCRACGQQAPAAVSSSDLNQPLSLGSVAGDSARCHVASRSGLPGRRARSVPRPHAAGQGLARPVSPSSFLPV